MPQRVSKVEQRYAARTVTVGETFDVHPNDIRLLVALGRIEAAPSDYGYIAPAVAIQKIEPPPVAGALTSEVAVNTETPATELGASDIAVPEVVQSVELVATEVPALETSAQSRAAATAKRQNKRKAG